MTRMSLGICALAAALTLCAPGAASAGKSCGGPEGSVKKWAKHTFSTPHAYDVAAHLSGFANSFAGTGVNIVNGMLFTMATFFSDERNVNDFAQGRAALEGIATANAEDGINRGSAGHYGRKAGFTSQELSELGL